MSGLVKAEILWTRRCPLKCAYCAMIDYDFAQAPIEQMVEGVERLHALGCRFFAIYGSSPLWKDEFTNLPAFVEAAESRGILTTVIADAIEKKSLERMEQLYDAGMRSLTCSFDGGDVAGVHVDKMTRLKSQKGVALAVAFAKRHPDLRDVQLTATVTKKNWRAILDAIPALTAGGLWFSFDFIHPDRGHPGTKCKGQAAGLRFEDNDDDRRALRRFALGLYQLKTEGALVHQSDEYLEAVADDPTMVTRFAWTCHRGRSFPAWLTIDSDGSVLPCDDFFTDRSLKVWDLDEPSLQRFGDLYRGEIESRCAGCAWSTHWDAVRIRDLPDRTESFDHYVHRSA